MLWLPAASTPPARSSRATGGLEVGKDADLVLVDDALTVRLTVAEGVAVYREGV